MLFRAVWLALGGALIFAAISECSVDDWAALGCGPRNENPKATYGSTFVEVSERPAKGNALIYVVYPGSFHTSRSMRLGANGRWLAVLKEKTYYAFEVPAGVARLCWVGTSSIWYKSSSKLPWAQSLAILSVEDGMTYFLKASPRGSLVEIGEAEWKQKATNTRAAMLR